MCADKIFKILYAMKKNFIDYKQISKLTGIEYRKVSQYVSVLMRREGIKLEKKYGHHVREPLQIRLVECTNEAWLK